MNLNHKKPYQTQDILSLFGIILLCNNMLCLLKIAAKCERMNCKILTESICMAEIWETTESVGVEHKMLGLKIKKATIRSIIHVYLFHIQTSCNPFFGNHFKNEYDCLK